MKKTTNMLFLAAFVMMTLMTASCQQDSKLKKSVEQANKECPVSIGLSGDMTAVTLDEESNTVIIDYLVSEKYFNVKKMKSNTDLLKERVYSLIATAEGNMKTLVEELLAADANLTLRWTGKESGKQVEITLSSKDIKADRKSGKAYDKSLKELEDAIALTNAQAPMPVDDATTMTSLTIVGDYATYEYVIDETVVPFHKVMDQKEQIKLNIRRGALMDPSPELKDFINLCKKANKGLAYKYVGSRGELSFIIEFPVDEL